MKLIFSDFDGTLTNDGQIGAIFFDILDLINQNNSELIIVSGRSLSWGHFFLTHFPLQYCIMEGGGVIVYKDDEGNILEKNLVSDEVLSKLDNISKSLCQDIPKTIMSADSFGRRCDRAIEIFKQDDKTKNEIEAYLTKHNVNFSKSNVHLNFWLEDLSKAHAVEHFLKKYKNQKDTQNCLFFGDAANDESMFEYFEDTIGVSNISEVLDQLTHKPKVILKGKENEGARGVYSYLKSLF